MKLTFEKGALYVAQITAWLATMGSLYFSEVERWIPCEWCWRQRILMYPMALLIPMGILRKDENLPYYTAALSGLGIGASTFHYLLQKTTWLNQFGTCSVGVPCSTDYLHEWGFVGAWNFVTIPFLALIAFLVIFVCSLLVITGNNYIWDEEEKQSWLAPLGIVAAFLIVFVPFFVTAPPAEASGGGTGLLPGANTAFVTDGVERGYDLYATKCAVCHGDLAQGVNGAGPALLGTPFLEESGEAEWVQLVIEGKNGMPARGGSPDLTDEDIAEIWEFLQAQREP
jgi:disulfide bond formation protein DsbB/mono/diheme cytochrome c family protein